MSRPPSNLMAGVTAQPSAEWMADNSPKTAAGNGCRSTSSAIAILSMAKFSSGGLRAMCIRDRPNPSQSPWQNGRTERPIGSIRREGRDHVVVIDERHLRHVFLSYIHYYNSARTHLSLNKDAPVPRAVQAIGRILSTPILGRLHHQYISI
jgi:hypothetical protein